MVVVPAGPFIMGSDEFAREGPRRTVEVDAFLIDRFPVTNVQFLAFVEATGHPAPADWQVGRPVVGSETHPVMVNWLDADAYATWAGKRLPTEAEWEKAARGTDGRRYPWGDAFDPDRALTWETSAVTGARTEPVDARPAGASPYGCEQMVGLAEEWCADWYDAYPGSDYRSAGYGRRFKVLRGGAWIFTHTHARCAYRCFEIPDRSREEMVVLGAPSFRCAADHPGARGGDPS
jgi:iron(II)-dependent oxidoreductase